MFIQAVIIDGFFPVRIPRSGNITISINGSNFNISDSLAIEIADTPCIVVIE